MDHPAVLPLYQAWTAVGPDSRRHALAGIDTPGPIALRSRYRHLHDAQAPAGPLAPELTTAAWQRILDLETEGDLAVQSGELERATAVFAQLAKLEPTTGHRVVLVHARIGAGDVARARDRFDEAIAAYEEAVSIAGSDRYRFGELRASVALGYLALAYSSGNRATELFRRAATLAEELGDPLYGANTALGLAECLERADDLDGAIALARTAFAAFGQVGSLIGQANAAHRAGALLHRVGRLDEAAPLLEQAYGWYTTIGDPVGLTNTLSGLGDLFLDRQEFDLSERWYAEGLRQAEATQLPRARAHALQDVARVSRGRGAWSQAVEEFGRALAAYREIDDLGGVWHALDKIAEAQAELGGTSNVARTRLESVYSIEEFRAGHDDERSQREYRDRFGPAYSRALAAATDADDAAAFAVVADCLAGRRLAGLIGNGGPIPASDAALLQGLLAQADQRFVQRRRARTAEPGTREQRIRLLGAFGIRHGLAERAETSLDDQLAAVYLPPERDGEPLLAAIPAIAYLLEVLIDPAVPDLVRWMWRAPGGRPRLGSSPLGDTARDVLTTLGGPDRIHLRTGDLQPVSKVLPPELLRSLRADDAAALLIVPVGDFWMVPWSGLPLSDDTVLGERVRYAICPSLTVQRLLAERKKETSAVVATADVWRSPLVSGHDLSGVDPARLTLRPLATPAAARKRLRDGSDMMIVVGHGRPAPGLGHYLELDRNEWLVPADLLGVSTPRRLALLVCEAASTTGPRPSDPVSLATLALAAGSDEVLATLGELADSWPATQYADDILTGMAGATLPEALHLATRKLLTEDGTVDEPLFSWAVLAAIGTL
ncbi:CHAT domain-containing protein [Actinoplanes sp. NPDC089786]|uniref:tetratricopeptide repeat protein n=1 Tax=Actinoplanes sp. NPDC089786 TaxID=3155185 RepID=UPI00343107B0